MTDYKALVERLTESITINFGRPNEARRVMDGMADKLRDAATAIEALTARAERAEALLKIVAERHRAFSTVWSGGVSRAAFQITIYRDDMQQIEKAVKGGYRG